MDTLSRLKGMETKSEGEDHHCFPTLDTLSRLKGMETPVMDFGRGMSVALDTLSRLKGMETIPAAMSVSILPTLWIRFPV